MSLGLYVAGIRRWDTSFLNRGARAGISGGPSGFCGRGFYRRFSYSNGPVATQPPGAEYS